MSLINNNNRDKTYRLRPDGALKNLDDRSDKRKEPARLKIKNFNLEQLEMLFKVINSERKSRYTPETTREELVGDRFFVISDEILEIIRNNKKALEQPPRIVIPRKRKYNTAEDALVEELRIQARNKLNEEEKKKEIKKPEGSFEL